MEIISIEGMQFFSPIGCFAEEKIVHPHFIVDVYISLDASVAMQDDKLESTINYQEVYLLIKNTMERQHNLIEHASNEIINIILEKYDKALSVKCKIRKTNPPLGGQIAAVAFEATKSR